MARRSTPKIAALRIELPRVNLLALGLFLWALSAVLVVR